MSSSGELPPKPPSDGVFAATHWSIVLAAGGTDSTVSSQALETLCRAYWPPIYAYVRRAGHNPEDARDLTQSFFTDFIANNSVARADPKRGRFRSYLLGALKHFLADIHDRTTAQKRGGDKGFISLDANTGESNYALEPADEHPPEKLFQRRWALTVMARAMERLEEEWRLGG